MRISELSVPRALRISPQPHADSRGVFLEWYRPDLLAEVLGHRPPDMIQGNLSVSARGVMRGIHFAQVPHGQAKYVTCVSGAVLDVVVDLRAGSPAFGRWETVRLDDSERAAVYLPEGFGHGLCALTEHATVSYLVSRAYEPEREHSVHVHEPELAIDWPTGADLLSSRDRSAPSLSEVRARGLLTDYRECLALTSGV
ncbi:dTDP-4-dehydrorhamnose 3,5-epimerase [Streptomyces sp. NBC_01363]|uniref:dTDP-4-dehydrorhamnose 3,5-epimerase n=1 Tax=Streptomyces sp. NBC_01363 TaxID=2903840 RepID=UPI0022596BF6|nr:dTDP-4-dehydrorhamnose 3,5-epimerase [Streptomyces sp. NBC_01363]MCX4733330.1 dTDP-4-dehydrorhamnose 3,5-epimerase [Streptomyces sp. NBC_01363]